MSVRASLLKALEAAGWWSYLFVVQQQYPINVELLLTLRRKFEFID